MSDSDSESYSSDSSNVESSTDNEKEMLLEMAESREDLFMYIKTDPSYYLDLIQKEKIGPQLNIMVSRDGSNSNMKIKYKIHPNDRWTEVGYFSETSDEEVIEEFIKQVNHNIHRTPIDPKDRIHTHLDSQLAGDNNMQSENYMKDIEAIKRQANESDPIKKLINEKQKQKQNTPSNQIKIQTSSLQTVAKQAPQQAPQVIKKRTELEIYQEQMVERILSDIPKLLKPFPDQGTLHYDTRVLNKLGRLKTPNEFKKTHEKLVNRIENRKYIMDVSKVLNITEYPELEGEIVEFHRDAIRMNPYIYKQYVDIEKFGSEYLDDIDREILEKYSLDVEEIWDEYLQL
jgi:hypothetical protein